MSDLIRTWPTASEAAALYAQRALTLDMARCYDATDQQLTAALVARWTHPSVGADTYYAGRVAGYVLAGRLSVAQGEDVVRSTSQYGPQPPEFWDRFPADASIRHTGGDAVLWA